MVRLEPLTVKQKKSKSQSYNHSAKPFALILKNLLGYLNPLQERMKLTKKV